MIVISLSGCDIASYEATTVKARGNAGPVCPLARKLIESGRDENEIVTIKRGNTICFSGETLGWWASQQARESDTHSAKFFKYVEREFN